jgi:hypothetical protein
MAVVHTAVLDPASLTKDEGRQSGGDRHTIAEASQLSARSVLGGVHREYSGDRIAA